MNDITFWELGKVTLLPIIGYLFMSMQIRLSSLEKESHKFREEVYKNFASRETIESLKKDLIFHIETTYKNLDTQINQLNKMIEAHYKLDRH